MAADTSGLKAKAMARYGLLASEGAQALKAELRVRSPHKTYELRSSIDATSMRSGPTSWKITLTAPVVQAATTNTGARPHIIRPRSGKLLRFYSPKLGRVVFARIVHHPGNRGTHWWDKVLARRGPILRAVLARL